MIPASPTRKESIEDVCNTLLIAASISTVALCNCQRGVTRPSYVAMIEGGELRVGVLEFLEMAKAIGFDPARAIQRLAKIDEA